MFLFPVVEEKVSIELWWKLLRLGRLQAGSSKPPYSHYDFDVQYVTKLFHTCVKQLLRPGIEPGSSACEALVLTDIRTKHSAVCENTP
jgi:hypothetical protein